MDGRNEDVIHVMILWHLHQPPYRHPKSNTFILPWVRLHATKNYHMMLGMLEKHPGIHATMNVTPSLIEQLEAYTLGESDTFLDLTMKPASELTLDEKEELLWCCFLLNWDHQVTRFPRYTELLGRRGRTTPREKLRERLKHFSEEDMRDLQVLYNLAWMNVTLLGEGGLRALVEKGRGFAEEDKYVIRDRIYEIIAEILPSLVRLGRTERIEVSTSPCYHPIMPLLCDSSIGRVAVPAMELPRYEFSHPEDARAQLRLAVDKYRSFTGHPPAGFWPPEGSVSEEVLELLGEAGATWCATDEEILARSKNMALSRGRDSIVSHPEVLYRPYRAGDPSREVAVFFRDRYLSDHIGFVYSRWTAEEAVGHFMTYLDRVRTAAGRCLKRPVISIILDGENPWEYFAEDGSAFLDLLYSRLEETPGVRTVTPSSYLVESGGIDSLERLDWIFPGSWINANFRIWIGHPEDNRAWDLLSEARKVLAGRSASAGEGDQARISQAWQDIYRAQSSDWFWWYGDDHSSETDAEFDRLFRSHLQNVYEILGEKVPPSLYQPIKAVKDRKAGFRSPRGSLTIHMDGRVTSFYEWHEAGRLDVDRTAGARAIEEGTVRTIHWGQSVSHIVLRIDFREGAEPWPGLKLFLKFVVPIEGQILIYDGSNEGTIIADGKPAGQYVYDEVLEVYIERSALDVDERAELMFVIVENSPSGRIFQHPDSDVLVLKPSTESDADWLV